MLEAEIKNIDDDINELLDKVRSLVTVVPFLSHHQILRFRSNLFLSCHNTDNQSEESVVKISALNLLF